MHSHFIPGIDDGSPDMETSLRLIRGLIDLGYKKIITTPHILSDLYPNTPAIIGAGRQAVLTELKRQDILVDFQAAAEYLMDDRFTQMLEDDQPLLTLKDKMVLVELSFAVPSINLKEILFQMQIKGYQPVLAHPERYLYFGGNKDWYDQLKEAGCLFQVNLLSLKGYYGKASLELAQYLVKKKYVDLLGTDMHHERHLESLRSPSQLQNTVDRLIDSGLIRNATL
ncbi:MAG TPA: CpsB/CapC family capsule biosynthesis tyrosine phosphatase [Puia sp.]|nr:CpsB/CapC family capsule biosynthesis tyrosine phosphatase [Puia sp.]